MSTEDNVTSQSQIRALATRILQTLSDILNSIAADFDNKADVTEMKTYIKTIEKSGNVLIFKDGDGNIVTPIVTTKLDPQLSLSPNELEFSSAGGMSTVTVTTLSDGAITVVETSNTGTGTKKIYASTEVDGKSITVNGAGSNGELILTVTVAETDEYSAASAEIKVTGGASSPAPSPEP